MSLRPPAGFIRPGYNPLEVPDAPTIGTATGGDTQADVTFTAPSNVGGAAITAYYAVSNPDQITTSGTASPITVTGLTNGTAYTFQVWALNSYGPSPYSAASGSVTPAQQRAIFAGGDPGTATNVIQYVVITTTGNATDFGDLTVGRSGLAGTSSSTRGVFGGGRISSTPENVIDYITIASAGNAIDFGDLSSSPYSVPEPSACSNQTRAIYAGGLSNNQQIQYITIATTGNATNFGDLSQTQQYGAGCASTTRGISCWGVTTSSVFSNVIEYVTIATTGNSSDFGDCTTTKRSFGSSSSSTRGIFGGGYLSNVTATNNIEYITIASLGNTTDFGDLSVARSGVTSASSTIRALFGGGRIDSSPFYSNVIDYITIASVGNATDFGDLINSVIQPAACSNCHGGL